MKNIKLKYKIKEQKWKIKNKLMKNIKFKYKI